MLLAWRYQSRQRRKSAISTFPSPGSLSLSSLMSRVSDPLDSAGIDQPQIELVHEGGGLQRVVWPFAAQLTLRKSTQFLVDPPVEAIEGPGTFSLT